MNFHSNLANIGMFITIGMLYNYGHTLMKTSKEEAEQMEAKVHYL